MVSCNWLQMRVLAWTYREATSINPKLLVWRHKSKRNVSIKLRQWLLSSSFVVCCHGSALSYLFCPDSVLSASINCSILFWMFPPKAYPRRIHDFELRQKYYMTEAYFCKGRSFGRNLYWYLVHGSRSDRIEVFRANEDKISVESLCFTSFSKTAPQFQWPSGKLVVDECQS